MTTPVAPVPHADTERLADYIADAMVLRERLRGWEDDSQFIADGGRVLYSVDTDIIKLYLDPSSTATPRFIEGQISREGYTQIFRHDEAFTALALADAVCEAIFFPGSDRDQRSRALGTVVVPPLDEELADLFNALLNDARTEGQKDLTRLQRDEELVARFASPNLSLEERYNLLRAQLPEIARHLLDNRGPHAELSRLHELSQKSRLLQFQRFLSETVREVPELKVLEEESATDLWLLARVAQGVSLGLPGGTLNADRDSKAMGRLAVLNAKLEARGLRVVHITGATTLFRAAGAISGNLAWDAPSERSAQEASFADRYLRHPASFLADPAVPFPTSSNDDDVVGLIEWLDVFLTSLKVPARRFGGPTIGRAAILKLARRALERDRTALEEFEERWQDFVEPMVMKRLAETNRRAETVREVLSALRDRIQRRFAETWQRSLETVTATGYIMGSDEAGIGPARDVPLVWFDCETAAEDAIAEVQAALGGKGRRSGEGYPQSILELRKLDADGYFYFVGFGVLFASANRWRTTQILAEQAIAIASQIPHDAPHASDITGREAYYLACVARRNNASTTDDIQIASLHLQRAFEALERDRANQTHLPPEAPKPFLSSLRFEAEQLALELTAYLFARFELAVADLEITPWHVFWSKIDSLLRRLGEEQDERIRRSVHRRLLINLLSRYLHDEGWRDAVSANLDLAARLSQRLMELKRSTESDSKVPITYLHRAVMATADLVIPGHNRHDRRAAKRQAESVLKPRNFEPRIVTKYDRRRFEELMQLCREA